MEIERFSFEPEVGFLDRTIFPTEPQSEQEAREQFMILLNQLKDYVNLLAENIENLS